MHIYPIYILTKLKVNLLIRVLLLKDDDLLTGGIASLLHQVDGISVIARNTNDIPDLFTEMDDIIPSILILKNSHVFADAPSMMKFLIAICSG